VSTVTSSLSFGRGLNGGRSLSSGFPNCPTCLSCQLLTETAHNRTSSVHWLGTDRTENTVPLLQYNKWALEAHRAETSRLPFSRQSAHRGRCSCLSYAPPALYSQVDSWYSFLLGAEPTTGPLWGVKIVNYDMGNRTRDLPACIIVPQSTTLPRVPVLRNRQRKNMAILSIFLYNKSFHYCELTV
jgi:hypothetical protein